MAQMTKFKQLLRQVFAANWCNSFSESQFYYILCSCCFNCWFLTLYMISISDTYLLQYWSLLFVQWEILWLEMIVRLR
jgi:hypothetical protein